MEEKKVATGFAGIGQRAEQKEEVPPIGEPKVEETTTSSMAGEDRSPHDSNASAHQGTEQPQQSGSVSGSRINWPAVIIFGVIALLMIVGAFSGGSNRNSTSSSNEVASTPTAAPAPNTVAAFLADNSAATSTSTPAPTPTNPSVLQEEKPLPGSGNLFSASQIRYCLAEKIRMQAMQAGLSSNAQIDAFNAYVEDYNSRCAHFRYYQVDMDAAQRDVESYRGQLVAGGQARLIQAQQNISPFQTGDVPTPPPALSSVPNSAVSTPANLQFGQLSSQETAPEPKTSTISPGSDEKSSIESVCLADKVSNGPAAYDACVQRQLASLQRGPRTPDMSALNPDELSSIQTVCLSAKVSQGPVAMNRCYIRQLKMLRQAAPAPDLSSLNPDELSSIQTSCLSQKVSSGPAAYNACLRRYLRELEHAPRPDTSGLTSSQRSQIAMDCIGAKVNGGPAAYDTCVARNIQQMPGQ